MTRWSEQAWFRDPKVLVDALDKVYDEAIKAGKVKSSATVTRKKVMTYRGWTSRLKEDDLLNAILALELLYIPQSIIPGPGFFFPIRDVTDEIRRGHIRLYGEDYDTRYINIGDSTKFAGPAWCGVDEDVIGAIIRTGSVLLVEGPFDLLAVRTIAPEVPSLCPLGKRLTQGHRDYLNILGVGKVFTLWDADEAGRKASSRDVVGFRTVNMIPPNGCKDPADTLKNPATAYLLREMLVDVLPAGQVLGADPDE